LKAAALLNAELGLRYLRAGQTARAQEKLDLALKQNPHSATVQQAWGYFYILMGNQRAAIPFYNRSIHLAPDRGDIQNNYGVHLCQMGQYRQSLPHFDKAVRDPKYAHRASAYENAGQCAMKIPDKKLAREYFRKAAQYGITKNKL
jgi:type IV pilus assembly protein PilF